MSKKNIGGIVRMSLGDLERTAMGHRVPFSPISQSDIESRIFTFPHELKILASSEMAHVPAGAPLTAGLIASLGRILEHNSILALTPVGVKIALDKELIPQTVLEKLQSIMRDLFLY